MVRWHLGTLWRLMGEGQGATPTIKCSLKGLKAAGGILIIRRVETAALARLGGIRATSSG